MKLRRKLIFIIALAIFVLYLSNDFALIDIKETALIVALGIDKQDEIFEVSAQIAIPQATDQTANNNSAVITGRGKTIALAIDDISARTGWYSKLSFCNVLVFGSGLLDGDVMRDIDFFIRTEKIQDSADICVAENTAKEILTAASPLDDLSSFAITKLLQRDAESSSSVTLTSLREFAMDYYSKSKTSMLPVIRCVQSGEGEDKSADGGAGKKGDEQKGEESTKSKEKGDVIFDATTTVLLYEGKKVAELNSEQTLAYNLLTHKINETSLELLGTEVDGEKTNTFISMRDNKSGQRLTVDGDEVTLCIDLKITAKLDDANVSSPPKELAKSYTVPDNILRDLETRLEWVLTEIFALSKESGCDVYKIKDRLFKTCYDDYERLSDSVLEVCKFNVCVKADSFK